MFLLQVAVTTTDQSIAQNIVNFFLTSGFVLRVFFYLKIITIVYTFILLVAIVLIVISSRPKAVIKEIEENLEAAISKEEVGPEAYGSRWQEIVRMVESKDETSWHLAVIEADKFFDNVMKRLGYSGENFSERLKQVHATEVSNLNDIWQSHRIRNLLTHDVNYKLSQDDARRAIGAFERALKDMDIL